MFDAESVFISVPGTEDCLTLNVYRTAESGAAAAKKPVMVFIHGGAYLMGSGSRDFYSPDLFMDYDIVRYGRKVIKVYMYLLCNQSRLIAGDGNHQLPSWIDWFSEHG